MKDGYLRINHRKYIVYYHMYEGKIFYVGMGKYPRPFSTDGRSTTWYNFVEHIKCEFDIRIVGVFRLKKSAGKFERKEILRTKAPVNGENRIGERDLRPRVVLERLEKQVL